jgi:uncharacterized protein YbcI
VTDGRVLSQQAPAAATDPLAQICQEVAGAIRRAWGRGPTNICAHRAGPNTIVVLLEDGHTDHERSLRAAGHDRQLLEGRELLQQIVEDELRAIVETATGRVVATMLGATRLDPDLSAEIFLLLPARSPEDERSVASPAAETSARSPDLVDEAYALLAQAQQAHVNSEASRSRRR